MKPFFFSPISTLWHFSVKTLAKPFLKPQHLTIEYCSTFGQALQLIQPVAVRQKSPPTDDEQKNVFSIIEPLAFVVVDREKTMKKNLLPLIVSCLLVSASFLSCKDAETATAGTEVAKEEAAAPAASTNTESKDIVDVAVGSPDHTTLVAAVTAAGLVETLKGAGPYTVFAPTNAAFAALPAGTVDGLLKPENKAALTNVLTYHVVSGSVKAADLKDGQKVKTLQGEELTVTIKDGKVMINEANVSTADLTGSNGVIHVLDAVLMPKK